MENVPTTTGAITDTIMMVEGKGLVPTNFTGLWELSRIFAVSGFMPKDMIGKPEAVFVAINMGAELGLSPMAAIQNIAVINGRPSIWGDSVLAIVRASGKMNGFSETFQGDFPNDNYKAVCKCQRGEETVEREFAVADAKAAKLWQYPTAGVTPWHKYPKRMLQMRARSWALRDCFGDVLKGITTAEEAQDFVDLKVQDNGSYAVDPEPEPVQPPQPKGKAPDFEALVTAQGISPDNRIMLNQYIDDIARKKGVDTGNIKKIAVENFDRFWTSFLDFVERPTPEPEQPPTPEYPESDDELMAMAEDWPNEYKKACLETSDPNTQEKCEKIKKRMAELIDISNAE